MDGLLAQLIDAVETDEATQPTRDALMENLYSALAGPRLENSWGETFITNGVDAYIVICGGVAARAALLDYHLCEYEDRLEQAMRSPDRNFGSIQ
jgi:hypothetical protein